VNAFFGITTMIISIPTGAKVFNWLFTMFRGRIRFEGPFIWVMGFIPTFVLGGLTGVLLAVPPADFVLHNSLFLVAHFHNVIIGGVVFGLFAGIEYWFPKAFGFTLDKFWGKVHFWGWVIGYWVAWTPIYIVGLMGTTRRVRMFDDPTLQPYFIIAAIGAGIILIGIVGFLIGLVVSYRKREQLKVGNDPWHGRTLEWSTTSPPPSYNFAFTPVVHDLDAWYDMKSRGYDHPREGYRAVHMPRNTGTAIIQAGLAAAMGFGMIWYIWWLAILAFVALVAVTVWHSFDYNRNYDIPAEEVARVEREKLSYLDINYAPEPALLPTPKHGAAATAGA
jgi:cytochrome o ubiquinol oxidase subunit 1